MDNKSKILFLFLFTATLISVISSYYKYQIKENYVIFQKEEDIPSPLTLFKI